jgi:hypothetical protein
VSWHPLKIIFNSIAKSRNYVSSANWHNLQYFYCFLHHFGEQTTPLEIFRGTRITSINALAACQLAANTLATCQLAV